MARRGADDDLIPLYGFLEGDTMGLLIVGHPHETAAELAWKLQQAANVRVAERPAVVVVHDGRRLDPGVSLAEARLRPLDRFDVVGVTDDGD